MFQDEAGFPDNVTGDDAQFALPVDATLRLRMYRGDSFTFALQVFADPNTGELSAVGPNQPAPPGLVVQNLTGWRVWCTVKRNYGDPDNQAVTQLDNLALGGVTFALAVSGKLSVTIPAIATRAFPNWIQRLLVDLQGKDVAGTIRTIAAGLLSVIPDVTNAIT